MRLYSTITKGLSANISSHNIYVKHNLMMSKKLMQKSKILKIHFENSDYSLYCEPRLSQNNGWGSAGSLAHSSSGCWCLLCLRNSCTRDSTRRALTVDNIGKGINILSTANRLFYRLGVVTKANGALTTRGSVQASAWAIWITAMTRCSGFILMHTEANTFTNIHIGWHKGRHLLNWAILFKEHWRELKSCENCVRPSIMFLWVPTALFPIPLQTGKIADTIKECKSDNIHVRCKARAGALPL